MGRQLLSLVAFSAGWFSQLILSPSGSRSDSMEVLTHSDERERIQSDGGPGGKETFD